MVMMGIEFTGTVPFSYVYLHGLIRDSQVSRVGVVLFICMYWFINPCTVSWICTASHVL
jgi:hypothetical protein